MPARERHPRLPPRSVKQSVKQVVEHHKRIEESLGQPVGKSRTMAEMIGYLEKCLAAVDAAEAGENMVVDRGDLAPLGEVLPEQRSAERKQR